MAGTTELCRAAIGPLPVLICHPSTRRPGVIGSILSGRSFRKQPSHDMAFPHPQPRKNHERKEDKPGGMGIAWKFVKRTIDITEYRNGKNEVNPANNRTLGGKIHGRLQERGGCMVFDPVRFTTLALPWAASWALPCRTAWRTRRSVAASRRTSWPRGRRGVQWADLREADPAHRNRCATRQHP